MFRIISGIFVSLFGLIIGYSFFLLMLDENNFISNIGGVIFGLVVIFLGCLLIYFGNKFLKRRKNVIDMALQMYRENGQIEITKIHNYCNVGETDIRSYLLYAQRKGWLVIDNYNIY